ncbi:hypothetical protein [Streptomyces sp. NRRL S-31]|uniref:hypothetical protein n=1 Tax=Streptomyces sp. NRRL S-31 TaxID=1463898 RepID=UPI0020A61F7B|nr:hypothetical protein [Streptomyces sp. NRRL S-31]
MSHALTTLGDTRRARQSQERALELSAPTSTMTRTLLNIDAAACARHDGDIEQACHRTVAALASLPTDYRTGLVRRRALDLYEAIPTANTTPSGSCETSSPSESGTLSQRTGKPSPLAVNAAPSAWRAAGANGGRRRSGRAG